ncbi:MAG TPA: chorismate mutase, partial [Reyranella sp.]|nr:chorismate mutase [Reyranella sp.]
NAYIRAMSARPSPSNDASESAAYVEVDARVAPEACASMAEVREGVDALDRALVQLIAERVRYMDAAARIKDDRGVVRDEARIEDVVAKVKAAATQAGLPHAVAEPVWRQLIERCIAHELVEWDRLRAKV